MFVKRRGSGIVTHGKLPCSCGVRAVVLVMTRGSQEKSVRVGKIRKERNIWACDPAFVYRVADL